MYTLKDLYNRLVTGADFVLRTTFVERDGLPVVRIAGVSLGGRRRPRARDFTPDPGGLPTLAVLYGKADPEALARRGVH